MAKNIPPATRIDRVYDHPGHLIRRAHQISGALFSEYVGPYELTPVQYAAMAAIDSRPGIDATRLSDMIAFDRATIGGVIDRLESKGLVTRIPSTTDRRIKGVSLSAAGRALLNQVDAKVAQVQEEMLKPLSAAERRQLITLLRKFVRLHREEAQQRNATG